MQSAGPFHRTRRAVLLAIGTICTIGPFATVSLGTAHAVEAPVGNLFWQLRSGE